MYNSVRHIAGKQTGNLQLTHCSSILFGCLQSASYSHMCGHKGHYKQLPNYVEIHDAVVVNKII